MPGPVLLADSYHPYFYQRLIWPSIFVTNFHSSYSVHLVQILFIHNLPCDDKQEGNI